MTLYKNYPAISWTLTIITLLLVNHFIFTPFMCHLEPKDDTPKVLNEFASLLVLCVGIYLIGLITWALSLLFNAIYCELFTIRDKTKKNELHEWIKETNYTVPSVTTTVTSTNQIIPAADTTATYISHIRELMAGDTVVHTSQNKKIESTEQNVKEQSKTREKFKRIANEDNSI